MKWGLKGGISIDADSGPPRYALWCCGGICHQPDTFIQIGSGHTNTDIKQLSGRRQIVKNVLDLSFIAQPMGLKDFSVLFRLHLHKLGNL